MRLNENPTELLAVIGQHVVGDLDWAGLRGASVVVRELLQFFLTCKPFLQVSPACWAAISRQVPAMIWQLGIGDMLKKHGLLDFMCHQIHHQALNFSIPGTAYNKHSPGLQASSWCEWLLLERSLQAADGLVGRQPSESLRAIRADSSGAGQFCCTP